MDIFKYFFVNSVVRIYIMQLLNTALEAPVRLYTPCIFSYTVLQDKKLDKSNFSYLSPHQKMMVGGEGRGGDHLPDPPDLDYYAHSCQ